MEKLKKYYRKLHVRFILIICFAIVPINILILFVTYVMQQDYRQAILQAYEDEMNMYTEVTNKDFERISSDLVSLCNEEKISIINAQTVSQLDLAEKAFFESLRKQRDKEDILDVFYLKNNETGELMVGYGFKQYEPEYEKHIRETINALVLDDKKYLFYEMTEINGECYLMENLSFFQYSAGFLTNISNLMSLIGENTMSEGRELYLRDRDGSYEIVYGENTLETVAEEFVSAQRPDGSGEVLVSEMMTPGIYLEEYIPESVLSSAVPLLYRILWILAIAVLLVIPLLWLYVRRLILKPLQIVEHAMREIEADQLDFRIRETAETEEFQYLYETYNHMAENLKNLTIEAYELELEKVRLDAINSRLQVNPHLLLNSLNMIYSLALSKNYSVIQSYARNLMKYFRYILRKDQCLVTLREELEFVADFLAVQKIRFPGAFTYVYTMEDELEDIKIPPFIIENFVENSIKYSLNAEESTDIMVLVRKEDEILKISVVDTGNGMSEERCELLNRGEVVKDINGSHIGIWNCRKRLRLYYGENAVLRISSKLTEGTQVWIELPLSELCVEKGGEGQ